MRAHPILLLAVGLTWAGCDDAGTLPSGDGTLVVSTSTAGDDPDPDGFQLTIDAIDSLALLPSGTAEVALSAGRHTLSLLDVASHCSVTPAATLEEIFRSRSAKSRIIASAGRRLVRRKILCTARRGHRSAARGSRLLPVSNSQTSQATRRFASRGPTRRGHDAGGTQP